jgi:hypothetical protein
MRLKREAFSFTFFGLDQAAGFCLEGWIQNLFERTSGVEQ